MEVVDGIVEHVPKDHMQAHLIRKQPFLGNAWFYTTFEDENQNKVLKQVLRKVHQCRFEELAFVKLAECLRMKALKRKPLKRI